MVGKVTSRKTASRKTPSGKTPSHSTGARRQVIDVALYAPRPHQARLHAGLKRFNVLVAHRRFGKTVFCINELIAKAAANTRPEPRYAYVAPLLTQAKDVAWEYLKRYTAPIPGATAHESELRVDLPGGGRIRLYGADNADRLRGLYFDGVVLDEYAVGDVIALGQISCNPSDPIVVTVGSDLRLEVSASGTVPIVPGGGGTPVPIAPNQWQLFVQGLA